ncbi:MAG: GTP cyclohydrolase II [Bifidobacteriaceae bacterium]|jgi:3,4-dihydroxy 2-butanone 4-phosphate synthase/GTP cyclohydrolase II|nr:GTP cyclohydrolase II [Bifidobacteriaceae bacterium]MCI1978815.1 GTP cyclohydrolase II [Bifidobacteriaceae bacterium]
MFTGIIESIGKVYTIAEEGKSAGAGKVLRLQDAKIAQGLAPGDSLSVNGVCLTVVATTEEGIIDLEVMPQTLSFTDLGSLQTGDRVNLERSLGASGTAGFGGHIVLGHVDGVGTVVARVQEGISTRYTIQPDPALGRYIAAQGSIAIDGISLTVARRDATTFDVAIIPHTKEVTVIGDRKIGDHVNIEVDVAARYREQYAQGDLTADDLIAIWGDSGSQTDSVDTAIEAIRRGELVVVMDDESRENEGDLICAAQEMDPQNLNVMASKAKGLICMPMSARRARHLHLEPMVADNTDNHHTAFTVSVDHVSTTTGISAFDRATTARACASDEAQPEDFRRPGHMFPLVAKDGGVLERNGHTEATVDLVKLAGAGDVGLCCEIMAEDGSMMRRQQLMVFARLNGWPIITIAQLQQYRRAHLSVRKIAGAHLPTSFGDFDIQGYLCDETGEEAVALVKGAVAQDADSDVQGMQPVLVRVHSECLTGDAFGSLRCDCGDQLRAAMRRIEAAGRGVIIYLEQEGRGIGLLNKIRAYAEQDEGADTVDANTRLGLPVDARHYGFAAAILRALGIGSVNLLTNNPDKMEQLESMGISVAQRTSVEMPANPVDHDYLVTKRDRMGHLLSLQ